MEFNFCPKCGTRASEESRDDQLVPVCQSESCGFIFWQNSKPCAVGMINDARGRILMTVRDIDPDKGKLDLPGGFLFHGEEVAAGLKRELKEELGVEVEVGEFVGHKVDDYGDEPFKNLIIAYQARVVAGVPQARDELAGIEWVDPNDFDKDRLAFTNNEIFLNLYREKFGIRQKSEYS